MTWQMQPANTMSEFCQQMHEYFHSMLDAGFTEHQALHIILGIACCGKETK